MCIFLYKEMFKKAISSTLLLRSYDSFLGEFLKKLKFSIFVVCHSDKNTLFV